MGLFSAVEATLKGPIKKEQAKFYFPGLQLGFSSPIIDGDRLLQIDNSANIFAFDVVTGRQIWDSRGRPTVEAEVVLESGALGRAIAQLQGIYVLAEGMSRVCIFGSRKRRAAAVRRRWA